MFEIKKIFTVLEKNCDFLQIINRGHSGLLCLSLTQFSFLFYSSPWNSEVYVVVNLSKKLKFRSILCTYNTVKYTAGEIKDYINKTPDLSLSNIATHFNGKKNLLGINY